MKKKKIIGLIVLLIFVIIAGFVFYRYNKYTESHAFFNAVVTGDIDKVNTAINNGIDIDSTDHKGATALHFAMYYKQFPIVKELLQKGANPNIRARTGNTPLTHAITNGNYEIVKLLLDSGVPATQCIVKYMPALHYAVQEGHIDIVKLLIERGADVNRNYFKDATPLFIAVSHHTPKIVKLLLEKGATPNANSIAFATNEDNQEIIKLLREYEIKKQSDPETTE